MSTNNLDGTNRSHYFITATDTDAGKTYVAQLLVKALVEKGNKVAVFKPISAGCEQVDGKLINEDAKLLSRQANCDQSIEEINPIAFLPAIAPHIAANQIGTRITLEQLDKSYQNILDRNADIIITEGAGGWRLPLGNELFLSDFAKQQRFRVILVVNMKLGCLNHALLTFESILNDGLFCAGWVANCQAEMNNLDENLQSLQSMLPIPCLGILDHEADLDKAVAKLNISLL